MHWNKYPVWNNNLCNNYTEQIGTNTFKHNGRVLNIRPHYRITVHHAISSFVWCVHLAKLSPTTKTPTTTPPTTPPTTTPPTTPTPTTHHHQHPHHQHFQHHHHQQHEQQQHQKQHKRHRFGLCSRFQILLNRNKVELWIGGGDCSFDFFLIFSNFPAK